MARSRAPVKTKRMNKFVALLRGINVGGNKRVPMLELCRLAKELGFHDVKSYVQSGNLVLRAPLEAAAVESALEGALREHFGFGVDVIVRSAREWESYAKQSPFADAESERPHLLHLALSKQKPLPGAVAGLLPYAKAG